MAIILNDLPFGLNKHLNIHFLKPKPPNATTQTVSLINIYDNKLSPQINKRQKYSTSFEPQAI